MSERISSKDASALGSVIKNLISQSGYRQIDFANIMGISASRLSNYINGTRLPDFFTLCKIADILNVSVAVFSLNDNSEKEKETKYLISVAGGSITSLKKIKHYQNIVC